MGTSESMEKLRMKNNNFKLIFILIILTSPQILMAGIDTDLQNIADNDYELRMNAAVNLGNYQSVEAKTALVGALNDEIAGVRICALNSLSRFKDKNLIDIYINTYQMNIHTAVKRAALQTLSRYSDAKVWAFLKQLLSEPDLTNKGQILTTLSSMNGSEVVPILLSNADSSDEYVQLAVVVGLGKAALQSDPGEYLDNIIDVLNEKRYSKNEDISEKAQELLALIEGTN